MYHSLNKNKVENYNKKVFDFFFAFSTIHSWLHWTQPIVLIERVDEPRFVYILCTKCQTGR